MVKSNGTYLPPKVLKKSAVMITTDNLLAETVGFEPTCDCSQTDFEQMGMRPGSYLKYADFWGIFAGLFAVYEKFAGKLRDACEMDKTSTQAEYHNPLPWVVPGKQIPAVDLIIKLQLVH